MTQRSTAVSNLVVVRWATPEPRDSEQVHALMEQWRARANKPLVYLAIIPADTPAFSDLERRMLIELTERVLPLCARMSIVVEARGLRGAVLRSAMTAVMLLTRRHDALAVTDSVEAAVQRAAELLPPLPMVRQALREVGCEVSELRVA